jgi:hypothetical protein
MFLLLGFGVCVCVCVLEGFSQVRPVLHLDVWEKICRVMKNPEPWIPPQPFSRRCLMMFPVSYDLIWCLFDGPRPRKTVTGCCISSRTKRIDIFRINVIPHKRAGTEVCAWPWLSSDFDFSFFRGKKKQTNKQRGNVNRDKDQFKTFYCSLKVTSDGLAIIYQSVRYVKWVLLFALLHFLFVFVILRTDGGGNFIQLETVNSP